MDLLVIVLVMSDCFVQVKNSVCYQGVGGYICEWQSVWEGVSFN